MRSLVNNFSEKIITFKYFGAIAYSLGFGLVTFIAYYTYFNHYDFPQDYFWDEQYHIPSAQKYLNGVFFMEPHPPLGKMLIALGEKLFHANPAFDQYRDTDFAGNVTTPEGFSFTGYRFFPALAAWLTAPVMFGIFLVISKNLIAGLLLSSLYLFDNALIVHNRGAMLDGILLFFTCSSILAFLLVLQWRDRPVKFAIAAILYGFYFALAVDTKATGLILLLLIPAVLWQIWRDRNLSLKFLLFSLIPFAITFCVVWQVHFSLATQISPNLSNQGYFDVSSDYRQVLEAKATNDPVLFPMMLRESLAYIPNYNANVPKLDMCSLKDGGSPAFLWPFGARTLNYRWETADGFQYRYLYLQSNPIGWSAGLLGILLCTVLVLAAPLIPQGDRTPNLFLMCTFLALYLGYMVVMLTIKRTMYLYHYFPPLIFSYILFGISTTAIAQINGKAISTKFKLTTLAIFALGIFLAFQFYRPLTYYEPITDVGFRKRAIFPLWNLKCINCEYNNWIWTAREPAEEK
ncbi:MAG: phospholipid carrier-dependent glycosyltransferase [Pseudanabaenaceae cyanobacterium bins.68]|nr:phospholipid carrier-dependent glycosyltransferase [Pseudanabaenaceae cyanobacterium bins.68]